MRNQVQQRCWIVTAKLTTSRIGGLFCDSFVSTRAARTETTSKTFRRNFVSYGHKRYQLQQTSSSTSSRYFSSSKVILSVNKFNSSNISKPTTDNEKWHNILPLQDGSHNSSRVVIPADADSASFYITDDDDAFAQRIASTVTACRKLNKTSLWIEIPMARASFIEKGRLYEQGFRFHHAVDDIAVCNLWLKDDMTNKIPEFATHNIGVGAVVLNSSGDQILVVEEKFRPQWHSRRWKIPTGLSELGESIDEAAIREVREETGLDCTFDSVLCFRQTHDIAHGRSDLFFACQLHAIDENQQPQPQECEIEHAEWIPLQEYKDMIHGKTSDSGKKHEMMIHVIEVLEAGKRIQQTIVESVLPGREPTAIYFPRT